MAEILTVVKSTLQFCFISAGTTVLSYIKNKKEQFKSKKSLTEINLDFDVHKTHQNGFCVFSMKILKRNEISNFLFLTEIVHSIGYKK